MPGSILFVTISGRRGASSRYRVYQYLPMLEKAGYRVQVLPPLEKKGKGLKSLLHRYFEERLIVDAASKADIVFIQKRLFRRGFIGRLKSLGRKLVFDFDDAIFTSPKGDWSAPTRRKVINRLKAVLACSDLVVAGNGFLKTYAEEAGAGRTMVLPTAIDLGRYRLKEHHRKEKLTLGWIGSSVNYGYIDLLSCVLPVLSEEFQHLSFLVVSDKEYRMSGVRVLNRPWSEASEIDSLLEMDIGLMPLADGVWTRGKCALKALQYMSCGIPAVCSALGANLEIMDHAVDGFLVQDEESWLEVLRELILSPDLRISAGKAGRKKVEEKYCLAALGPQYLAMLDSLLE